MFDETDSQSKLANLQSIPEMCTRALARHEKAANFDHGLTQTCTRCLPETVIGSMLSCVAKLIIQ